MTEPRKQEEKEGENLGDKMLVEIVTENPEGDKVRFQTENWSTIRIIDKHGIIRCKINNHDKDISVETCQKSS